eukprot:COSAG06_NODE_61_length_27084_cov_48.281490_4_plen_87_part_00
MPVWVLVCRRYVIVQGLGTPYQVRKRPFIYIQKLSFYQDRLGTNIGKTQKKCRFPSESYYRVHAYRPRELPADRRYVRMKKTLSCC